MIPGNSVYRHDRIQQPGVSLPEVKGGLYVKHTFSQKAMERAAVIMAGIVLRVEREEAEKRRCNSTLPEVQGAFNPPAATEINVKGGRL